MFFDYDLHLSQLLDCFIAKTYLKHDACSSIGFQFALFSLQHCILINIFVVILEQPCTTLLVQLRWVQSSTQNSGTYTLFIENLVPFFCHGYYSPQLCWYFTLFWNIPVSSRWCYGYSSRLKTKEFVFLLQIFHYYAWFQIFSFFLLYFN